VNTARTQYGLEFEYEDITEYDFKTVIDIDDRTSEEIIRRILDDPIAMGIRPLSGAVEVLTKLSRLGPLLFVTARPERESILEWVHLHLPSADKGVVRIEATGTHEEKIPVLLRHRVKYFVEDCLETCRLLEKSAVTPIVFQQPWNQKRHPYLRVGSWREISELIAWDEMV
jgi:uncharacterized HAD superfamily protein